MKKVSEEALEWALVHAENFGDTDVFPIPFEFEVIRHSWDIVKPILLAQDLDTRPIREHRRFMAPKGLYAYRVVTQIDPMDFLLFTALTYEIGQNLEDSRSPATDRVVHSSRFNPDENGRMFSRDYNYASFMQKCREFVGDETYNFVVIADIADFYPRIYLHRIESALSTSTSNSSTSRAVVKFLKGWQDKISYGIPVGSAPSRLLAEITIDDVDKYLLSDDTYYCRYSDDFRIFCKSKHEAYSKLETLSRLLFENHGLFLQPAKTKILKKEEFEEQYLRSHYSSEIDSLSGRFHEIVVRLGLDDPYQELDYKDFPEEIQVDIDGLNLEQMVREQLQANEIDVSMFRFLLKRLGQINRQIESDELFDSIGKCYHLVPTVVTYLKDLEAHGTSLNCYADNVVDLLTNTSSCQLPFNRMWWLSLPAENKVDISVQKLMEMNRGNQDLAVKRKLILSLGKSKHKAWFRQEKNSAMNLDPWSKRAFIAAASCMAADEYSVWCDTIRPRLDEMGKAILQWARDNPF
jgi:hypothetical protein